MNPNCVRKPEPGTHINVDGYTGYNKLKDFKRYCYAQSVDIFWKPFQKAGKRITPILQCRDSSIAINSLNMSGVTGKKVSPASRYITAVSGDQKPVVEAFPAWINKQNAPNGSRPARALTYARNQQNYMMTYLEDGHCSISNNLSENSIRPITVGRRNWLFCDTTDGADASMMIYSLLETARANGLNPQKYLEYLL